MELETKFEEITQLRSAHGTFENSTSSQLAVGAEMERLIDSTKDEPVWKDFTNDNGYSLPWFTNSMNMRRRYGSNFLFSVEQLKHELKRGDFTSAPEIGDMNYDVLLEMFRHFVAIQDDGAFILTLVSAKWRDIALQTPSLWQWISINGRPSDWVEKLNICVFLSSPYPLYLVIRLPVINWKPVIEYLLRCRHIFFEVPDYMTGRNAGEITEEVRGVVPDDCVIHWYRAGVEILTEEREPIKIPIPNVINLTLNAAGSEHPNYHRYAFTRSLEDVEYNDEYTPLILLKSYRILDLLQNMHHLHTFTLSHHAIDPLSSDIDLPVVNVGQLQHMCIKDIDFLRNGNILPLLEHITAPQLSTLSLSGEYTDVLKTANALTTIGRPTGLILCLDNSGWPSAHRLHEELEFRSDFRSVNSLLLNIDESLVNGKYRGWPGDKVSSFLGQLSGLITVTLIAIAVERLYRSEMEEFKCIHHSHDIVGDEHLDIVPQKRKSPCRIRCFRECPSISFTDSNQIQELSILSPSKFAPRDIQCGAAFASLIRLKCTPFVLITFLSQRYLSSLQTIHLHWPTSPDLRAIERELRYFDAEITTWFTKHDVPFPLLRTFGVAWYPEWKKLFPMLYHLARGLSTQDFTLQLPAYPHPAIQRTIRSALAGIDDGSGTIMPTRGTCHKYLQSQAENVRRYGYSKNAEKVIAEKCYYCWRAQIQCTLNHQLSWHCDRHSRVVLVSLTRETLINTS